MTLLSEQTRLKVTLTSSLATKATTPPGASQATTETAPSTSRQPPRTRSRLPPRTLVPKSTECYRDVNLILWLASSRKLTGSPTSRHPSFLTLIIISSSLTLLRIYINIMSRWSCLGKVPLRGKPQILFHFCSWKHVNVNVRMCSTTFTSYDKHALGAGWVFFFLFLMALRGQPHSIFRVDAVRLCDHTTGCEAHPFMTDEYGIFHFCAQITNPCP